MKKSQFQAPFEKEILSLEKAYNGKLTTFRRIGRYQEYTIYLEYTRENGSTKHYGLTTIGALVREDYSGRPIHLYLMTGRSDGKHEYFVVNGTNSQDFIYSCNPFHLNEGWTFLADEDLENWMKEYQRKLEEAK